jgi:SNF2 family DNA or RNA helicase
MILFGCIKSKLFSNWIIDGTLDQRLPLKFELTNGNTHQLTLYQEQEDTLSRPYVTIQSTWSYSNGVADILLQDYDELELKIYIKSYNAQDRAYIMVIELHVDEDVCLTKDYLESRDRPLIFDRLFYHKMKFTSSSAIESFHSVSPSYIKDACNSDDKENIYGIESIYPYQIEDIDWALKIESRDTMNEWVHKTSLSSVSYTLPDKKQKLTFTNNTCYKLYDPESDRTKKKCLFWNGGILCHEVGMGKTIIVLGMINATIDRQKLNLVICPRRLLKQWVEEIKKFTKINVIPILSITQYRKLCKIKASGKLQESGSIVVLAYSFLTNDNYQIRDSNLDRVEAFEWNRIILDEAHEYLYDHHRSNPKSRIENEIFKLNQTNAFRWVCSATPYTNLDSFIHLSYFLQKKSNCLDYVYGVNKSEHGEHFVDNIDDRTLHSFQNIAKKYMCRRLKSNENITIPPPHYENVFLEMTSIEDTMYQTCVNDRERVMICTHILVSDFHNRIMKGESISMIELKVKYAEKFHKKKQYLNTRIRNINATLALTDIDSRMRLNLQAKLEDHEKELHEINQRSKIFETIEERIVDNEICSICLDPWVEKKETAVLHCGHFVCTTCCGSILQTSSLCPMCRSPISKDAINYIKNEEYIDRIPTSNTPTEIDSIKSKHGSKMAYLITQIQSILEENEDNRIIVFSMWDVMLKLVVSSLNDIGIENILLKGTASMIANNIVKFKSKTNCKVLMMSSDKQASGLNIVEATHIFLLDSVNSKPCDVSSIEKQAVGRAVRIGQSKNVKIYRTIMKDTIEEEHYEKLVHLKVI